MPLSIGLVPELSRSQLLVYGAIAIALLLVGARWLRSDGESAGAAGGVAPAEDSASGSLEVERGGGELVVHVAGAVREAGVYRLPDGARVTDAIERAGGTTGAAVPDAINLAATLADGQQVVVPGRAGGPAGAVGATASALAPGEASGPISLGTATVEQLDTIEGIGPVTAQDILEFRDEHGGVGSIDELDQISGIGPATMEALRDGLQP
ncbi:MAG: ComEA family DNA-binding protein [Solirubrobacterales bacterium]|nr:ComEA family DNA-binding protein [Solirubrobacterales bacterium]